MSTRKLWSATRGGLENRTRFASQAATYRWVNLAFANYAYGDGTDMPIVNVWIDERDGQGWQLYERVDLQELAAGLSAVVREARW